MKLTDFSWEYSICNWLIDCAIILHRLRLFRFHENINNDPGHVDVPASCIPKHLHHLGKHIRRSTSSGYKQKIKENGFRIVTEPRTLYSILQCVSDSEVAIRYLSYTVYLVLINVKSSNCGILCIN